MLESLQSRPTFFNKAKFAPEILTFRQKRTEAEPALKTFIFKTPS